MRSERTRHIARALPNKELQQTKRGMEGILVPPGVINVRFAAELRCWADNSIGLRKSAI